MALFVELRASFSKIAVRNDFMVNERRYKLAEAFVKKYHGDRNETNIF